MRLLTLEGNSFKLDGGAMFGNAPKELWRKWVEPDPLNRIPLASRCFLLQGECGKNVLFETGIGVFFDPKMRDRYGVDQSEHVLLKNLGEQGIGEEDVDYVILSHLHFDHAGGLLPPYGERMRLLFPRAKYIVGKRHWERANDPHLRERISFIPELHTLLAESGRLVLVEGERCDTLPEEFFGAVRFVYSDGHTIGLMMSEITVDGELYVFVSDLVPGKAWVHLPLSMGYDRYSELTVTEKGNFYGEWKSRGATLLFTHDPFHPTFKLI